MQNIEISGIYRKECGKGPARRWRARGQIPAVLYTKGSSAPVRLDPKEMNRVFHSASGENSLITLHMTEEGSAKREKARLAMFKEVQRDPVTGDILHVDLFEVAIDKAILFRVPVEIVGNAVGAKAGGVLQQTLRELEIKCLPSIFPDRIRVDVSALKIGDTLHVKEIALGEGIKWVTDLHQAVVSVVPPLAETKTEALPTPDAKDTKEPEVTGQKEKEGTGKAKGKG